MAIVIKRSGMPPYEQQFHGTCQTCGCVLECRRKDAKASHDQREPGPWIKCPTSDCPSDIGLKPGLWYNPRDRDPR